MTDGSRNVQIQATYWIMDGAASASSSSTSSDGGEVVPKIQTFGFSPSHSSNDDSYVAVKAPLRIGLPEDIIHPEKRPPGDDSYSGLHDQGPLPPLKEDGPMAWLLACVQEARKFNDEYLTEAIARQRKTDKDVGPNGGTVANPVKKAKVDS